MADASIGRLELAVLLSVARLGDDAYGASIRRDLCARLERDYSVGAVYTTLQRLEDKRLLVSRMGEPTPERGGRARRNYRLTAGGREALDHARDTHDALWAGVRLATRSS